MMEGSCKQTTRKPQTKKKNGDRLRNVCSAWRDGQILGDASAAGRADMTLQEGKHNHSLIGITSLCGKEAGWELTGRGGGKGGAFSRSVTALISSNWFRFRHAGSTAETYFRRHFERTMS